MEEMMVGRKIGKRTLIEATKTQKAIKAVFAYS
jgi:hypothetical protein